MRQPPAWQCYASDWLAREEFRLASLEERGLLWTMLNQVWVSDSLPCETSELAKLLGLTAEDLSRTQTAHVMKSFLLDTSDRLVCPELKELKSGYIARTTVRSAAGKKGAKDRWRKEKSAIAQPSPSAKAPPEKRLAEQRSDDVRKESVTGINEDREVLEYRRAFGEAK